MTRLHVHMFHGQAERLNSGTALFKGLDKRQICGTLTALRMLWEDLNPVPMHACAVKRLVWPKVAGATSLLGPVWTQCMRTQAPNIGVKRRPVGLSAESCLFGTDGCSAHSPVCALRVEMMMVLVS